VAIGNLSTRLKAQLDTACAAGKDAVKSLWRGRCAFLSLLNDPGCQPKSSGFKLSNSKRANRLPVRSVVLTASCTSVLLAWLAHGRYCRRQHMHSCRDDDTWPVLIHPDRKYPSRAPRLSLTVINGGDTAQLTLVPSRDNFNTVTGRILRCITFHYPKEAKTQVVECVMIEAYRRAQLLAAPAS